MKIFVTGASGFIGSAIMKMGTERGHQMIGLDVNGSTSSDVVRGNIEDAGQVKEASRGCDAVVHTASLHSASLGTETDHTFYRTNILGSANVFQAALENGIERFVFASSLDVHCGVDWAASGIMKYSADTPVNLTTVYGTCKFMIEQMGHYYRNSGHLRVCALRYTNVAWSCARPQEMSRPINLLGRDITVEDCAKATLRACEVDEVYDEVLLIGQDTPLTSAELVRAEKNRDELLEAYWPGCLELLSGAGFCTEGPIWPLTDISRAKQVLGWKPRHSFDWFLDQVRDGLRAERSCRA